MDDAANFHWFVGLIEGEGCFLRPCPSRPNEPRVEIEMKDEDVIARAGALMGAKVRKRVRLLPRECTAFRVRLAGHRAATMMLALRPYLCARRQRQIDAALAGYRWKNDQREFRFAAVCAAPICAAPPGTCATHPHVEG